MASVKRLANRWQLVASYSATKKHRPIGAVGLASSSGFGTASPTFSPDGTEALYVTPNNEINTTDNTWEWDGKVSGTYIFPAEVLVSASFHHESGDPFARQVRFTGGMTIPIDHPERGCHRQLPPAESQRHDPQGREAIRVAACTSGDGHVQYVQLC